MTTPGSHTKTFSQSSSTSAASPLDIRQESDEMPYVSPTSASSGNNYVYPANKTSLALLSWNIWKGGAEIEDALRKQIGVITQAHVDIVFIQESNGAGAARLAHELGMNVAQQGYDCAILTAFPVRRVLTDTAPYATAALIETSLGDVLAWSVHLAPWDYGPYSLANLQHQPEAVFTQKGEQLRTAQAQKILAETTRIQESLPQPVPVIVAGDFNVPSGEDWAGEFRPYVQWPATQVFIDQGFQDAFRICHPNVEEAPGLTWSFIEPLEREPRDRIDFIYVKGLMISAAHHLGGVVEGSPLQNELGFEAFGSRNHEIPDHRKNDFPSDHFAVSASLQLLNETE
ncbi:hypothetical protein LMG33818_001441 [Halomonadaceae bacterium LMG 33818]|uniref:endonuclease/exonuclease/phosphatase family protein n=1 Tax=Cernens ardua TaxID=3402176 RepID=UPI003EDBC319